MPHQCVKCGHVYGDAAKEILTGCSECKSRFFFYVRKENLDRVMKAREALTEPEKKRIEADVKDVVGEYLDDDRPIILDLASVDVLKPGKFQIDLVKLFNKEPLIYKLEEGKYVIDVASTFEQMKKKK
jgi:predicted  nucleic acid-binding Zn-ribbon protein